MMKLGSGWLDFVAELVVVDVASPTDSVCVVGVGGVVVARV